jgi:hypothetical protein
MAGMEKMAFPSNILEPGMSLRDWFAGMALAGLVARYDLKEHPAVLAYDQADAMMAEREKRELSQRTGMRVESAPGKDVKGREGPCKARRWPEEAAVGGEGEAGLSLPAAIEQLKDRLQKLDNQLEQHEFHQNYESHKEDL